MCINSRLRVQDFGFLGSVGMSHQLEFKAFLGASVGIDVRDPLVIILKDFRA